MFNQEGVKKILHSCEDKDKELDYLIGKYEKRLIDLRKSKEEVLETITECRKLLNETDC
ncbi:hypothetical protein SAMN04487777_11723 [Priestia aryabhattai B8W22]|uniref:hypothetical protein n=1 Tax=Priestia aryabhattai TaxID=412384 RepID=UPI0008915A47|nr:hypothetical protein SAMN04487777_11723 [Priestia aryabhattai B8W22]